MGALKASIGTRLDDTGLLDSGRVAKLRALSVTTVEELFGLILADPESVRGFLDMADLARLKADVAARVGRAIFAATASVAGAECSLGALPPPTVDVERRASAATFERVFAETTQGFVASEPGGEPDLISRLGPIRDQGRRGTGAAHAVCAMIECLRSGSGDPLELWEQFVYWAAKQRDGDPHTEGTSLEVAVQSTVDDGVCLEATWPYVPDPVPGNVGQGPPPKGAREVASGIRTTTREPVDPRSPDDIKKIIEGGSPVAISIPVYENWYSNPVANVYGLIPMPLPGSLRRGGHAMCVAGFRYDDDIIGGGCFILRNSWGTGWAPLSPIAPGYGLIPFAYVAHYAWEASTATVW